MVPIPIAPFTIKVGGICDIKNTFVVEIKEETVRTLVVRLVTLLIAVPVTVLPNRVEPEREVVENVLPDRDENVNDDVDVLYMDTFAATKVEYDRIELNSVEAYNVLPTIDDTWPFE